MAKHVVTNGRWPRVWIDGLDRVNTNNSNGSKSAQSPDCDIVEFPIVIFVRDDAP